MSSFFRNISHKCCIVGLIFTTVGTYKKIQYERIEKQGLETTATVAKISYV